MRQLSFFLFVLFALQNNAFTQEIEFTQEEKQWIKNNPVFEFGYDPDWKPYTIYSNGQYTGIIGEYIKRIELATGIDLIPIPNMTWEKSLRGLKEGSIHMVPDCNRTDLREEYLIFTEPYITEPLVIITRNDYPFVGSFEDLEGLKIALPTDYWTNDLVRNDYPRLSVIDEPTIVKCLEALSTKKVDAIIGSLGVISYYINNEGYTNLKVAAPADIEAYKLSLAFTKDQTIFRDICQKVLNSISLQERSRIRKDWISVRYEYAFNWTRAFTWLLVIASVIAIAFLLIYLWNLSLRRQVNLKVKEQLELQSNLNQSKQKVERTKLLLKEIHHRVKNNLQIVSSLIRIQSNSSNNEEVKKSLNEAVDRIMAISLVHENIYKSSNLKKMSITEYLETLADDLIRSSGRDGEIAVTVKSATIHVDLQRVAPLALIVNELLTNSLKHAFEGKTSGNISINLERIENLIHLTYSDDGVWVESDSKDSFGTVLISTFTDQLDGVYKIEKGAAGTTYLFKLKLES